MKKKLLVILFCGVLVLGLTGCNRVKIVKSETSMIKYETYNNGNLIMQIPKGWKVEIPNTETYSGYTFKVYNPNNKDYLIQFSLGLSGFLKSEAARKKYASLYPSAVFGQLAAINPQTTEAFYKVWNTNAKVANKVINQEGIDVTSNYNRGAEEVLKLAKKFNIKKAVLKSKSPSCGKGKVYDGTFSGNLVDGFGITAKLLMDNGIEVLSEDDFLGGL